MIKLMGVMGSVWWIRENRQLLLRVGLYSPYLTNLTVATLTTTATHMMTTTPTVITSPITSALSMLSSSATHRTQRTEFPYHY